MKSPFPGMDPYLERHWGDVHQRLCTIDPDVRVVQEQWALSILKTAGKRA